MEGRVTVESTQDATERSSEKLSFSSRSGSIPPFLLDRAIEEEVRCCLPLLDIVMAAIHGGGRGGWVVLCLTMCDIRLGKRHVGLISEK